MVRKGFRASLARFGELPPAWPVRGVCLLDINGTVRLPGSHRPAAGRLGMWRGGVEPERGGSVQMLRAAVSAPSFLITAVWPGGLAPMSSTRALKLRRSHPAENCSGRRVGSGGVHPGPLQPRCAHLTALQECSWLNQRSHQPASLHFQIASIGLFLQALHYSAFSRNPLASDCDFSPPSLWFERKILRRDPYLSRLGPALLTCPGRGPPALPFPSRSKPSV